MSNRKKPDHLHVLQGTHRKDRANPNEPKPRRGIPNCPSHLGAIAKKEWRRVSKILDASRLLTHADSAGLMIYCELWERLVEVSKAFDEGGRKPLLEKHSVDIAGVENTEYKPNPLIIIHRQTVQAIRPYLSAYGLTPFDRPKLEVPKGEGEKEPKGDPLNLFGGSLLNGRM